MPNRSAQQPQQPQQQGAAAGQQQHASSLAPAPQPPLAFLWMWVGRSLLALLTVRSLWFLCNIVPDSATEHSTRSSSAASFEHRFSASSPKQVFYFYNEVSGQVQWEDPGEVPFEEEDGTRYWLLQDGSKSYVDPGVGRYTWAEQYSPDLQRAYFYNQETQESSWERPADLSWRRVVVTEED